MKNRRSYYEALLVVTTFLMLASCSGPSRHQPDAGPDSGSDDAGSDRDTDIGGDSDRDARDADVDNDNYIDGPEDVPRCGDGVLDPEEECDDWNRFNGDGCDWLCRLGDGEPQPEPDPSFSPYGYGSEPVYVEGSPEGMETLYVRLPLVWTGSELATVFMEESGIRWNRNLCFYRYDEHGTMLDSEWEVRTFAGMIALDLVWNGEGYTLFYNKEREGIFALRLSTTGKPISVPVLVVDDPCAWQPVADLTPTGHTLAWIISENVFDDDQCPAENLNPEAGVHVSLVADDSSGSRIAGPLRVLAGSATNLDVAAGPGGVVVVSSNWPDSYHPEAVSFFLVDEDMSEIVTAGALSHEWSAPSVVVGDREYWVAWILNDAFPEDTDRDEDGVCVVRISTEGFLIAAPLCTELPGRSLGGPRIAFGDGGLGIVVDASEHLLFLRTDSVGVAVGRPIEVDASPERTRYDDGPYAIVWADNAFVVLYAASSDEQLRLQRFEEMP